ncbi:MAG TPA: hypothetical protein VK430_08095 [Xanthobacteraceae bacterium]|nr:hypothetical protein [Xanthobacteraceae bacterium]
MQERHHIAGKGFRINVMAFGKHIENSADAARLAQHIPDFAGHAIEAEIRAGAHTQDNNAVVDVGRFQLAVANKDALDRDVQSCHVTLFQNVDNA